MKAAIVTFVRAYNYGAVLQCYALSKKMQDLGYETEVLDYYPDYFRNQYNMTATTLKSLSRKPNKMWVIYMLLRMKLNQRNRGFESFINKNIPLTKKQYRTIEEINCEEFNYDTYISGSDQVWSCKCVPFDPVFFLEFSPAKYSRKCSYAASFGMPTLPVDLQEEYKRRLDGWDSYSVREETGSSILSELLGVKVSQHCDPTLLLSGLEWDAIKKKNVHRKPYILIYRVNGNAELLNAAEQLAKEKNMDVISLSSVMRYDSVIGLQERQRKFIHKGAASPDEWLGLFAEAQYVLTDSFHGTVFSLINHKKFLTQCVISGTKNIRAQELLINLNLSDRMFAADVQYIDCAIDWEDVDTRLQIMRNTSMEYLSNLEGV